MVTSAGLSATLSYVHVHVLGRLGLCTAMSLPCTIGRRTRMKHYLTGTSLAGGKNRKKRFCVFLTDLDLFDLIKIAIGPIYTTCIPIYE